MKLDRSTSSLASREVLESLYIDELLDVGLIAMRLGVSASEVSAQLRAYGIPRRPACNRGRRTSDVELTRDLLEDLFIKRRLTIREMAALLNSPISTVFAELRRLGIVDRDPHRALGAPAKAN